jgi:hypothetical protein
VKRLLASLLLLAAAAFAADEPLLPQRFAEWEKTSTTTTSDPAQADPANAAVLQEFGFSAMEGATYTRPGRTLKLKAMRLADHSAAYGAFTFYKAPEMVREQIGDQAASANGHVLFYRGSILVDAVLDRVTAMSPAELRELANALPVSKEEVAKGQPPIIEYLPRQAYVTNSVKYVLGPAGLRSIAAPISADLADFSKSPEIATGRYRTSAGEATLTLLYYPTPQIAGERMRAIEAALDPQPGARPEQDNFAIKRTGPIVVLVTGAVPTGEAKSLLASITYDADVTWNEATRLSPRDNIGNLIWNIFKLIGLLLLVMIALGALWAAAKFGVRRYWPEYVHDSGEMIRLDLRERPEGLEGSRPSLPAEASK